jgi:hypothetical protein
MGALLSAGSRLLPSGCNPKLAFLPRQFASFLPSEYPCKWTKTVLRKGCRAEEDCRGGREALPSKHIALPEAERVKVVLNVLSSFTYVCTGLVDSIEG